MAEKKVVSLSWDGDDLIVETEDGVTTRYENAQVTGYDMTLSDNGTLEAATMVHCDFCHFRLRDENKRCGCKHEPKDFKP